MDRLIVIDVNTHIFLLGERMVHSDEILAEFIDEMVMENLNEILAEGRVTWSARNHEFSVEYRLVNGKICAVVSRMWIGEGGMIDIVFDHNMRVM